MMAEETLLPGEKVSVLLGLGSNLGGRREFIERAVRLVDEIEGVELKSLSSLIETEPVGGPPQGRYLNGAAELETALEPLDLRLRCRINILYMTTSSHLHILRRIYISHTM